MGSINKYLFALLGIVFLVFLIWYFSAIVSYILVALVISFVGRPLVDFLHSVKIGQKRFPKGLAAMIAILLFWALFIFLFLFVIPLIAKEFEALNNLDYNAIAQRMNKSLDNLSNWFSAMYGETVNIGHALLGDIKDIVSGKYAMGLFNSLTGTVTGIFVALFSITFITFFFLKDSNLFMKGVLVFVPEKDQHHWVNAFSSIKKLLMRYFLGILIEVSVIIILISIGLVIVGESFSTAIVIGILAGILNVIPYIGPFVGALLGVGIVALSNSTLPWYSELLPLIGFTALVFGIVQLIDNMILQPLIYSNTVFAHPLEIFLVILISGYLAGPVGMILAIPSYTILRVVAYEFFAEYEVVKRFTKGIQSE